MIFFEINEIKEVGSELLTIPICKQVIDANQKEVQSKYC